MTPFGRLLLFAVTLVLLILFAFMGYLIYEWFWVPIRGPQKHPVTYYTPCEKNFNSIDCSPRTVYEDHCHPDQREPRCTTFCEELTATNSRLCQYMDSCAWINPDIFMQHCQVPPDCGPDNIGGCDEVRARDFCTSGLASPNVCHDYCRNYYLCSWLDASFASDMRSYCREADVCFDASTI